MELWNDIPGYEGLYEVSTFGRVRTKEGKITSNARYEKRVWKQRYLKDKTPRGRDVRVSLWKDGEHKDWLVHRLVALTFLPKVESKESINHIDGNPKNNNVSNLEWCNHTENNNHAFDNRLIPAMNLVLVDKKTFKPYYFRSLSKASEFLGKNPGYLSGMLKKGKLVLNDYFIYIPLKRDSNWISD
ncbi:NUMOD4 domain-containing protein [Pisciglobus halotolerans]|uniref:NUMOD4 motif-containing protein n=1 Tax=Pisciglobus halotolerans TaxID=745365 RepID=A0A1I3BJ26_9LACT|nr:NUMOD4 domain-containing protein [Pisciglobus halotolerans]SFH62150.1 NUMOD4 motif-containing protein [Pisciglobus halotolerans]